MKRGSNTTLTLAVHVAPEHPAQLASAEILLQQTLHLIEERLLGVRHGSVRRSGTRPFATAFAAFAFASTDSSYSSRAVLRFGSLYIFGRLGYIFGRLETKPLNSALTPL